MKHVGVICFKHVCGGGGELIERENLFNFSHDQELVGHLSVELSFLFHHSDNLYLVKFEG